jgi:hypothetical protein
MAILDLSHTVDTAPNELSEVLKTLTPIEQHLAIETWRGRMLNEHVSARVFQQLLSQMDEVGVPDTRRQSVTRMMEDELRHGRQCATIVEALGGRAIAQIGDLPDVPRHDDADAFEGLLRNVISVSCLSETVAVALITAERLHAQHPLLERTLRTILADEVQHARFGWTLLDELKDELNPALSARLGNYLAPAFAGLRSYELANLPSKPASSPQGEAVGLCDGPSAREIFLTTVQDVIIPGLEAHGLPAARAWTASFELAA